MLTAFFAQAQDNFESLVKAEREAFTINRDHLYKTAGDEYDLLYHRIRLSVDPSVRFISGSVYSLFKTLDNNFGQIGFDLDDRMTVDSILYHGAKINFTHNSDQILVNLPVLLTSTIDSIEVFYHGDPSINEQKGFSYDNHMTGPIAWTLSEPYGAYGWWPCKNQLGDKVDSLDAFIHVPKGNKAAGLGLLQSVDTLIDSSMVFHWKHRYPVATYLMAVAVTNYQEFNHYAHLVNGDSIRVQEYIYPEYMFIADTQALKVEGMIRLFDSLCGAYPFAEEKYGHAQWGRGGGMEHQTMSFMSDLDYDLVAHELVHQWYGDKITCGSWQDIWLNEGFATFFTGIAFEFLRPQAEWKQYMQAQLNRATSIPNGSVFVTDTTNVSMIFSGALSYSKGAMVLQMLRWEMGDSAFFEGIRNYTANTDLCYGFARTADLQDELEQVYGGSLDDFFDMWVYKEGFPAVSISWNRKTTSWLHLDMAEVTSHSSVPFYPLEIELRARGSLGEDTLFVVSLNKPQEQIDVNLGFKVTGLEFDPRMWLLAKASVLEGDHSDLSSVALFPNPTGTAFDVYIKDERIDKVEIYSNLGQLVEEYSAFGRKNEAIHIDHNLSGGMYFVKVYVGDNAVISRLIIQ